MADPQRLRADLSLAGVTVVWGSTFVLVKEALHDCSPLLYLGLRFTLAMAALLLIFRPAWRSADHQPQIELRAGLLAGVCLFGGYFFQTVGLQYTTPAKSAFLTGLSVVLVPVLAALVYQRLPQPAEWIGVSVATLGMGLLTLEGLTLTMKWGDLLTLLCAVCFALHLLVLNYYSARVRYQVLSLLQIGTAAGLSFGAFWWGEPAHLAWSPRLVIALAITSLLGTALAFTVMSWAQRHTTATRAALILALEPAVAWVTAYYWADERFTTQALLGAIFIVTGILAVELKPMTAGHHPSS